MNGNGKSSTNGKPLLISNNGIRLTLKFSYFLDRGQKILNIMMNKKSMAFIAYCIVWENILGIRRHGFWRHGLTMKTSMQTSRNYLPE